MPIIYVDTKDEEVKEKLQKLAEMDMRSAQQEVVWLIHQEWAKRFSQPNAGITVAEATAAAETIDQ